MQKALAPDISTWPDDNPQLIGSQCAACAATTFPVQPRCPKCLHPFGRFEGKSAMEMGVDAIFAAVADAGVEWKDVQFATGGSWTVANPDAIVGMVGLTGIPFTNVFNACATAACADGIRLGDYDIGIAVGLDKHPRGAFTEEPALVGMPSWYAEKRAISHHPVLRHRRVEDFLFGNWLAPERIRVQCMKANRYLHDHGISQETLARWRPRTSATGPTPMMATSFIGRILSRPV